ncbi:MAG: heavy metal translocating P-type ATPase [Candidatus Limivicinus sp.]|jgi:Cd2+/Zn2+-exporting ATPase
MTKKEKNVLIRIIISVLLLPFPVFLHTEGPLKLMLFLIPYFIAGYDVILEALEGIVKFRPFDECFLMVAATAGAFALGEYLEAFAVMLFYQLGELFQSIAVGRSRRSISELMDIRPDYANLVTDDGNIKVCKPNEVAAASIILVKPGEKIPLDGIIVDGSSALDTAALTGESLPRDVEKGDEVISGCININGVLKIKTSREFGESTASKILELVENAGSRKSKSENFISKFARIYTPAVCFAALALAIIPPLFNLAVGTAADWGNWIYRALTFLVISCPCALLISVPLSFFAGIGGASRAGVLIKGSNFMETLSRVKYIVFDKTGTMTKGVFEVAGIHHSTIEEEKLLEYAALAESYSTHPISLSLLRAYGKEPDRTRVSDVQEIRGCGVTARVDGNDVAVGNFRLMEKLGLSYTECSQTGTVVHVAVNGEYCGHILIADMIKPDSKAAIEALKKIGIKKTVMLTGDRENVAENTARELCIDEHYSQLLPEEKVEKLESLLKEKQKGEMLAFAGDGINDAPVLARADIGIAMGALGSDAAIEAADVVLMDDNPMKISKAIGISRKCMRIVYENIYFAIGVKLLCLLLGALGIVNMWLAIFADVGVMVLAVLNAVRALNTKKI